MSSYPEVYLKISKERNKELNEIGNRLINNHMDLADFMLDLDKQEGLSSLEKIVIAMSVTFWVVNGKEKKDPLTITKVPINSKS